MGSEETSTIRVVSRGGREMIIGIGSIVVWSVCPLWYIGAGGDILGWVAGGCVRGFVCSCVSGTILLWRPRV